MRKLVKIALVALGIRALLRWWRRRQAAGPAPLAGPAADPADELRQKLAASREDEEATSTTTPSPTASVAERRTEVHEQGRKTLDEMTSSDEV